MEVMNRQMTSSGLNPDAPIFVPMSSYPTVEDFSDQWWDLVRTSPWFRHYWSQDYSFQDPSSDPLFSDIDDLVLPDFDSSFDLYLPKEEKEAVEEQRRNEKELISIAALKWDRGGRQVEAPKNFEKVPKIVKSVRVNPRTIHQPR